MRRLSAAKLVVRAAAAAMAVWSCGAVMAQSEAPNEVYVELTELSRQEIDGDVFTDAPIVFRRHWFFNMMNTVDASGADIEQPYITVNTSGVPPREFSRVSPDDPAVFSHPVAGEYRWNFLNFPVGEAEGLYAQAYEAPEEVTQAPGYTVTRTVEPLLLANAQTDQTVTVTLQFHTRLPFENGIGVYIGSSRVAYGDTNLVDTEFISADPVEDWSDGDVNGVQASWQTTPDALVLGKLYTFKATLRSIKSPLLQGAPLYKPSVVIIRARSTYYPQVTDNSITLSDLDARVTATYSSSHAIAWTPAVTDHRFDLELEEKKSSVTEPPFHVSVDGATVRIEPETLSLRSKGVITAFVQLPAPWSIEQIDAGSVACQGAPTVSSVMTKNALIVKCARPQLQGLNPGDDVDIVVNGSLTDGSVFAASDRIRVIP